MNKLLRTRGAAVTFFLCLALLTAGFSYAAVAQSASRLLVLSTGTASCAPVEETAAAVKQGDRFAVDVQGLMADEPIFLSIVFADGRVFSATAAGTDGGPGGLDGALDRPSDPGFIAQNNSGGDYAGFVQTTAKWPVGCHRVIAQGVTSQIQVADSVVVQPAAPPVATGGPLSLVAQSRTGQQASGEQGVLIDLFGRRFMSGETIQLRMIQPNGTIVDLPQEVQADGTIIRPSMPEVSTVGSFQTSLTLGTTYQEGDYTIIASSGNGQSISALFTLRRQPVQARGFGLLNVANPAPPAPAVQGQTIQLQGRLFTAGEDVAISLIQSNAVRRPLSVVQANQLGEFTLDLSLSNQLPVGQHELLAVSASTVVTRAIQLNLGPSVIPPAAAVAPITSPGGSGSGATATPLPATAAPVAPTALPASPTAAPTVQATAAPAPSASPAPTESAQPTPTEVGKGEPIATASPVPSPAGDAAPPATDQSAGYVDPCACNAPGFSVGSGASESFTGEPSDLIPIPPEAAPAAPQWSAPLAPTPSF